MTDARIGKLADVVADWSLGISEGDTVYIDSYEAALPFIDELWRRCVYSGAHVIADIVPEEAENELIRTGSDEQIRERYSHKARMARVANKIVLVESLAHPEMRERLPGGKLKIVDECEEPLYRLVWDKRRRKSVIVHFPTEGYAHESGYSLGDYENVVYKMALLDRKEEARRMQEVADLFRGTTRLKVEGVDTDLTLRIRRGPTIEDGRENMPAGEVYFGDMTGASASGIAYLDVPVVHGKKLEGVRLEFVRGKVVIADASLNGDYLHTLFLGEHRGFLEEIGFGTNPHALTNVYSWAEKAYGTIHLGVDNGHGTNVDIVKTMNTGRVSAYQRGDRRGRAILENGRLLL